MRFDEAGGKAKTVTSLEHPSPEFTPPEAGLAKDTRCAQGDDVSFSLTQNKQTQAILSDRADSLFVAARESPPALMNLRRRAGKDAMSQPGERPSSNADQ